MSSISFKKFSDEIEKPNKLDRLGWWVATITSVVAFLNIIVVSIGTVVSLCFLGGVMIMYILGYLDLYLEPSIMWYHYVFVSVSIVLVFAFAVIFYLGMYWMKPYFVLMYILFGAVLDTLLLCSVLLKNFAEMDLDDGIYKYARDFYMDNYKIVLSGCGVYTCILSLTCYTYILMKLNRLQSRRKPIEETPQLTNSVE